MGTDQERHDTVCDLQIGSETSDRHKPNCPLDPRSRKDRIAAAIGNPGSVLPRGHSDRTGADGAPVLESVTRWATHAVLAVLDGETGLPPGMAYLNDAPGDTTLQCQVRTINTQGVTFRCTLRAWHPDRQHALTPEHPAE